MSNSTCLQADLENSKIGSVNKSQAQIETRQGIKRSCLFATQSNTKASPFPSLRVHSKHEGTNMKCKPDSRAAYWRDPLANTGERSGSILAGHSAGSTSKGYSAGCSAVSTGKVLWDTQRETRRDPLAGCAHNTLGGV